MNKRRKAQTFSLLLAFLMLASVIPAGFIGFLKPVSAQSAPKITNVTTSFSVNGADNRTLFKGLPYEINFTVNSSTSYNLVVEVWYDNELMKTFNGTWNTNTEIVINSENAGLPNIPETVDNVTIVVYPIGMPNLNASYTFRAIYPYTVTPVIHSSVPYNESGTWKNDVAFKEIPFNVTVQIRYNSSIPSSYLPDNVTVKLVFPNGTVLENVTPINNSTGSFTFVNVTYNEAATFDVVVIDSEHNLTNTNHFKVYDWKLVDNVTYIPPRGYKLVPFNVTINVKTWANVSGSEVVVGINDTAFFKVTADSASPMEGNKSMVNGSVTFNISNITTETASVKVWLAHYTPDLTINLNVRDWNVTITGYKVRLDNNASHTSSVFYVGINSTLVINVKYYDLTDNSAALINGTANYTVEFNGEEIRNGTIPITNGQATYTVLDGWVPNTTGTVKVTVWDANYDPSKKDTIEIEVKAWGIKRDERHVYLFNNASSDAWYFYQNIPSTLKMNVSLTAPYRTATVNYTVKYWNGTAYETETGQITVTNSQSNLAQLLYNYTPTDTTKPVYVTFTLVSVNGVSNLSAYDDIQKTWEETIEVKPVELTAELYTGGHYNNNSNVFVENPYDEFYADVPQTLGAEFGYYYVKSAGSKEGDTDPLPLNTTLTVTITLPDGKVITELLNVTNGELTSINVTSGNTGADIGATMLETYQTTGTSEYTNKTVVALFENEAMTPGAVTVNVTDNIHGGQFEKSINVRDWGIYITPSAQELYVNVSTTIGVSIGEALYTHADDTWHGTTPQFEREVKIILQLPDGTSKSTVVNITANDLRSGYAGVASFVNVKSTKAGWGSITVVDLQTGKSTIYYFRVKNWDILVQPEPKVVYTNLTQELVVNVLYNNRFLQPGSAKVTITGPGVNETQTIAIVPSPEEGIGKGIARFTIKPNATGVITINVTDVETGEWETAQVEVHDWHVDLSVAPEKSYVYIPTNYTVVVKYIDDETGEVANLTGYDVNITYALPGGVEDSVVVTLEEGVAKYAIENIVLETNGTGVFTATDLETGRSDEVNVPVYSWSIEVETHPLYAHPDFKNDLKFPFRYVDENGDLVPFNGKANVTLVLPDGQKNFTGAFDVVNGEGLIDFGTAVITKTGNATLTVVQFIGDYNVTAIETIEVKDLVTITKVEPDAIYVDVPTEIKVYVESGANNYENIIVTLDGQELKYLGDGVYAGNFTLAAGNYTITAYDTTYNVTATKTITVESWHLVMSVTPDEFTAATLRTINITVKAVLDRNESIIAKIDDVFNGIAVFNNTDLYPIKTEFTVELKKGVGTTKIQLYAPDEGNYIISGKDKYGRTAEVTIPVAGPDTSKLSWVYVTIKKEGTLESPNETTVIYVAFNNRDGPYVPAYDFVNHKSVSGTTEAVFPLAPVERFNLYVIALPLEIAKDVPYIENISTFAKTWDVPKTYYNITPQVTRVDEITWNFTVEVNGNVTVYTYTYKPPRAPGVIPIEPQASSVWGNAIYTPVTKEISKVIPLEGFSETIELTPTLEIERVTPIDILPAKEGSYFELLAKLYVENAEEQFEQLFNERIVPKVQALDFLSESEKENLISELKEMAGNVSSANGPLAGRTVEFHIDNDAIAYVEPTNATTDENGTATFKVYSAAKVGMTPDELLTLMGAVNVWATYDGIASNTLTVKFGGVGSIAGIVMDENNNPVAGVEVVLYTFNGTDWVPAVDYNGNVLKAVTNVHGHYEIDGIPALPPLSIYRAVALVSGTPAGFAEAAVSPFQTSPVNIVITAEGTEATGLGAFLSDAQTHDVKFVTGSNVFNPDYYAKDFLVEYIGAKPVYTDKSINVEALTEKDMIIAIGGPNVNSITAYYQEMAPVKMVTNDDGSISIIVDNETVANWTAPSPWWNVTEGYWVIQRVVDKSGAVVYMIYGTDADSTWAAAYYFSEHFGELQGKNYVVGYWKDTDGQIFGDALKFASDDNNGFSPTDEIGVIVEG